MSKNDWGSITTYKPSMAAKAAEMFNAFNELWPGGFGGGIPYTEERVKDWLDKTSALADLIALGPKGELMGYCGLYPHWRDKNAAYISILGVTPQAKGKKFGKRLLLKALEIAKEKGIFRVDLHTWSGNLDAVPLYKKVGLFWVPDTTVYMQDYIPGLLQVPIAAEWFDKHPDWYSNFKRELAQTQDRETFEGMKVYKYKFQVGEDVLEAYVDQYAWGFSSFQRILDGKKIAVITKLRSHTIDIGIPNAMTFIIHNDYEQETEIDLKVKAFSGLTWLEEFPKKIKLKKGETMEITREFVLDRKAELTEETEKASKTIHSVIGLESYTIELTTSGKIQAPLSLRAERRAIPLPIEQEITVPLDVLNNTETQIKGKAQVTINGLSSYSKKIAFDLKKGEISGIGIPVAIPKTHRDRKLVLNIEPSMERNDSEVKLPNYTVTIIPNTNKIIDLTEVPDKKQVIIVTDKVNVTVNLEGGGIRVGRHGSDGSMPIRHQAGPPYGLSLDRTLLFDYEVIHGEKELTVVLSAESIQIPGLVIRKHLKVLLGLTEIEYWITYTNKLQDGKLVASARNNVGQRGISINPYTAIGKSFTPIGNTIVECEKVTNFMTTPLIPDDAEKWFESWSAAQGLMHSDFQAFLWKPETVQKIKTDQGFISQLECKTFEIKPNETVEVIHLWYVFSYTSLADIRNRWSQLVGNKQFSKEEQNGIFEITKPLEVVALGDKILVAGKTSSVDLEIKFVSAYPLPGKLTLATQKGWNAKFKTAEGLAKSIPMPDPVPFGSTKIPIEISTPEKIKHSVETVQLHFSGEFEIDFPIHFFISNGKKVNVDEVTVDGENCIEVSTGQMSFKVGSEIAGALFDLQDEKGRTFLADSFPKVQPKFFFEQYIGGLLPSFFYSNANNPFYELEKVKSARIDEGQWSGVECSWTISKDKKYLKGLKASVKYLTLPGSQCFRVILTLENPTAREISFISGLIGDVALGGNKDKNIIVAEATDQTWIRNPSKKPFVHMSSFNKPLGRVYKGKQSFDACIPKGYGGTVVNADFGVMLVNWSLTMAFVGPFSKQQTELAFLINHPSEKSVVIRELLAK